MDSSMIKTKIELMLRMSEVVGMKFMKGDMDKSEEDKIIHLYINELYDYIKQVEPKQESEIM